MPDIELIWVQIYCSSTSFLFGLSYRPPSSSDDYFSSLAASLRKITPTSDVLLCGDFNLPAIDWSVSFPTSSDRSSSRFCDILKDFFLFQLIRDPTRGNHILDLLLTNDTNLVSSLQLCDNLPGTDHDAVFFTLSVLPPKQKTVHRVLYNYKRTDFDTFRASLLTVPWNLAVSDDINLWWDNWKDLFFAAVSSDVSVVHWRRSKMKCWLSSGTIKLIKLKRVIYRRLKRSFSDQLFHRYKFLRNTVRKLTRADYRAYAEELSGTLHKNQKSFWNWINRTRRCRHPIPPLSYNSSMLIADYEKAQYFNDYFSSVFTSEDKSSLLSIYEELDVSNSNIILDSIQTSSCEVFELLRTLDVTKACGPDLICARLLKEAAAELSSSLADLFNKSLRDSVLPLDWVSANICPVYKKGDKHCVSNYRPISLTCILSKVLEKIVHAKLYSMLEDNNLLSNHQYTFRHQWSTTTLLLSVGALH